MEGDGMVAVVRGLREAGLAVTLLDGNRHYTLLPNTIATQPASAQRAPPISIVNAATQQCPPKLTADTSTEPALQCDRDAQAVDGRYTSVYKAMHCHVRPTSPPVQLTEFPPQRPELYPGHGNFLVGGTGSGANSEIRPSSPTNSFRGGMSWPDRGSVCSPRPSRVVDAFAKSLRKYPTCLSPDRSSEVMERLVNYTQPNKTSRTFRNSPSPSRISEPSPQNVLEPKPTFTRSSRNRTYEPDVSIRPKKAEDPPTRDRKKEEHHDKPGRGYDVRSVRDASKRMRESACAYTSYPYNHPVCPSTIIETHDYHPLSCDYQNSSNSVNMEIQAAVKMLSKEVATAPRGDVGRETVAAPEASIPTAGQDYVEGEFYFVENLDITTSIKSIQTNVYPSDTTLKPRKSAQTVFSTIDFHSSRNRTIVSRKSKSQEEIKLTKDELKISLLELINEISDNVSKNAIRDELIKKLFVTDNIDTNDHKCDRVKKKHDKRAKYDTRFCPTVTGYVGDYQELLGKLKHCFDDSKQVLRSEVKPFRLSEYRQLDFVIKDWVNQLNIKNTDRGRYVDRNELIHTIEDRVKELFTNWTKEDFDLKTEIVEILEEIPIEIHKSYSTKTYLRKLVDVLLKRMRNVVVCQRSGKIKKKPFANRSRKILTEEDMRDFIRGHLLDFFSDCNSRIHGDTFEDLENEMVDLMMESLDCIWCGHDDAVIDEMNIILQDIGKVPAKQANYLSNSILQEMLNNCAFNQTYTILNVSNNTGPYMNSANSTSFSIGSINEDDLQSNLDRYTNQLCLQINRWLDTLDIPRIQDSGFREVVVNDLAGDIVDRHKYIELNHTGKDTAEDQLEALKYQIFKWINKLVGDDNQETISHAENLLQMINSIPVPMLVNPQHRNLGPCCDVGENICPRQSSPKPYTQINQSKQCCGNNVCPNSFGQGHEINPPCCGITICPNESSSKPQGAQGHPGFLPCTNQSGLGTYGQGPQTANAYHPQQDLGTPNNRGAGSFGPASPDNPWGSNTFSTGFEPSLAVNLSPARNLNTSAGRTRTSGRSFGAMDQSNSGCCHSSSPSRPAGSIPVKKLNEDYDEFLKQWVKRIPIADTTPAEKQAAETARLSVYNGIWKGVTKMKLDPNIFAHQVYCQDVLEEDIERLFKAIPQSKELEAAKPTLKAQLLQKTLAMNDIIKSTNAPASFKQQLIDNIENNLPKHKPTENEADKENDELEKQDLAEYYILYTRYKDEDSVKATVYKKNFLKKLDEFLNKIKSRHNIVDMDTTAYANEIINSFDKIPTPNISATKDEADDILIAMEVENWVSDIPLTSDAVSPLEKRRTRDAIVKKINEIGADVSCCDNAFRIPLKAELPKYLDKLPIQKDTNIEYLVDELANRIKNLAISSMRRVSFQEPQNYEEFGRNMPAASSLLEMSEDRSSYMVVGGEIVKESSPRRTRWVREQTPIPEDEVEWLSLHRTQIPSIMRNRSMAPQGMPSPQVYNPNQSGQMSQRSRSPQAFVPNTSGRYLGDIPKDAGPNIAWDREKMPVPQKRQRLSMPERQISPNTRNKFGRQSCPGDVNFVPGAGSRAEWMSNQAPIPREESQWHSLERTQLRSGSGSPQRSHVYCPNASDQMEATQRSYANAQQVNDQLFCNAQASFVPNSEVPFSRNVQGHFTSFNQGQLPSAGQNQLPPNFQDGELCTGPPCCPNPLCNRVQGSGSGPCQQSIPRSPGPREGFIQSSNAQGMPCCNAQSSNVQGMQCCNTQSGQTSPLPQRFSGRVSPDRYNQSFGQVFGSAGKNVQNSSVPASQMQPQGPYTPSQSQGLQGGQSCSIPNNQGQSYGSRPPAIDPGRLPYQGSLPDSPRVGLGFGTQKFDQESSGQAFSHVPGSLHNSGQSSIYGVIQGSNQGYLDDQSMTRGQAHRSVHLPVLNQTLQNPGLIPAANQLPNQAPRPLNLQKMSSGGMGILGVSQVPGPSTRSVSVPISSAPNSQCCPIPGVQAVGTESMQQGVMSTAESIQRGETQPTHNKLGIVREKESPEAPPKTNKIKPSGVNEREVFNYKSVQTASSSIDITTTKCMYCEVRSKSQNELIKSTKTQEVIKRSNLGCGDLQQGVTEWYEIHSDKVKVKLWGEKMKKLAAKLKKPGGEEKLRIKIEKYLNKVPENHTDGDIDIQEFKKQLPNEFIRKLKKMYMCPKETNLNIYRMELPKYSSRFKVDNFRKTVLNWTKTLNIKKKDFLGRNVKKDDVFKYVADKLEPLVLDRPRSDSQYKIALQSNISELVYELPLALSTHNKDFYLSKVTESLVDKLVLIENKFSSTYIQPTTKEIKEFIKDELTFFLEKCRVTISTKKMEYLETELIGILLDLTDIIDIDSNVADDVTKLLKEVAKLPEYKAKYFTNLLLKDYKEFFFRENFFQLKGNPDRGRPDVYSAFQNATGLVDFNEPTSFERYRQRLVEEINKWITKLNISVKDKNFIELVAKDLASDIVDRYKYLLLNPSLAGTDAEELEQLKFQIFKWTNKLVGEETTAVVEHAQELMKEIKNIPKPSLQSNSVVQSMLPLNTETINTDITKPYIDKLADQIYDWYCNLPTDRHMSRDETLNKLLTKALAEDIEKGIEKEDGIIDEKVGQWADKVFKDKISKHDLQQLKNSISSVPFTKDNKVNDHKYEKNIIRAYEDIVDEWIDTVPITPKKQEVFTNNKNEIVHSLAVKILKIKTKMKHLPAETVEKKLKEELSHWLKKLPLHVKIDNQNDRDKFAAELVKDIQRYNVKDSLENQEKSTHNEPMVDQLEKVMRGWLKKLPLFKDKSPEEKLHQERIIKELAQKLDQLNWYDDLDEEITKHIRMLDPKQNDDNVQNTAFYLKLHLEKNVAYKDLCKKHEKKNISLVETIENWMKGLPLQVADVTRLNKQKTDFVKTVKRLMSSGSDNAVMKKEMLIFARTLPMSHSKKYDYKYLNEEVLKLMKSLKIENSSDVRHQGPTKSTERINDAIKQWVRTLPLKPAHSPKELRSFIDDMSSVISALFINQQHNWTEQSDARLHREISKFLRRFPLIYELRTESHIFRMASELSKTLQNISLFRTEKNTMLNNVAVYGVSIENKSGNTTTDYSIQSIKTNDINENLEAYTKQLINVIGEWFDRLNLPEGHQEGFKEVVINDLAGDIVDRHKYLELNPNNRGTEQDELEHLKYQIFKWINKLVGEENCETIEHAEELMQMINKIPVPMLVKPHDIAKSRPSSPQQRSQRNTSVGQQYTSQPVNSPTRQSEKPAVSNRGSPFTQQAAPQSMGSANESAYQRKPCCSQAPPPAPPPPEEGTTEAMYEKYVKIFKDLCNSLPIDESTPEYAILAKHARQAIYNAILKTFFNLKADPKIENDYRYFEFVLEETVDELLDVLPQTEELKKMRYSWKIKVLEEAINMLDDLHKLSDKPTFRQTVRDKFNRQFAIDNELQYCFVLQQGFLSSVADAYILETNYKEKDPVKANIYKNRLMKEIDKLVNHMVKEHNVGFRFFDRSKLARFTMKTLEKVPIAKDDILQDEVEEILLTDEIEKWYKELPTTPFEDEMDGVVRKRMIDLLAKKLHDMHKHLSDDDPSKDEKMKHEMSQFLEKKARLQQDEDLNINFMVDELHYRLKNRWLHVQDPGAFEEFDKAKPLSSTLAHVDNADFLDPLMDGPASTSPGSARQRSLGAQGYFIEPGHPMQTMGQVRTPYGGAPYSVQGSGVPGSPRKAVIHSMEPNLSRQAPYGTRMSPGRPIEGYVSQQGPYQMEPKQQSPVRQNVSQQVERPRQNAVHASMNSQIGSRIENINQSLRQVGYAGQMGPQVQNMSVPRGSDRFVTPQGQLLIPPSNQSRFQGQTCSDWSGNVGSRGPVPSQGTTAQAATGTGGGPLSSGEDMFDRGYRVQCRCLEAYRRMRLLNSEDQDNTFRQDQCNAFRPQRYTF
ncbi:hypothetical protein PYW08_011104 [Mythimna loreyi]|uniref:Uncharacterized protein n=1 Tax=Mythimna loreyi TaxID=667449 RepID=A0ACC2Q2M8_9NEOP|nr:hypothetical protein PYW08_011104 [Mythimna loreyi]